MISEPPGSGGSSADERKKAPETREPDEAREERRRARCEGLADDLREGREVTDFRFDQVYPQDIRELSQVHWTPVRVALQVLKLLDPLPETRVLDVGSGCGKFCLVAALSAPGQFFGIEQRPYLARLARRAAGELGAARATFLEGNMRDLDWSGFDAFYLFNPFYENKEASIRIDRLVDHSADQFMQYVELVRARLMLARSGTKVVTYHGYGGDLPPGYRLERDEPVGTSHAELWIKD